MHGNRQEPGHGHGLARNDTAGWVIHGAGRYDLFVWLYTLGGERRLRRRMIDLARLQPGEAVLDIGCGTGTLAILAAGRVGAGGTVTGIDASPEMLARAAQKAARAGAKVTFREGRIQALPLPEASVDVVLCTLMLHHIPAEALTTAAGEIARVLRPKGRLVIVDFIKPEHAARGGLGLHRHGHIPVEPIVAALAAAGLGVVAAAPLGQNGLTAIEAAPEAAGLAFLPPDRIAAAATPPAAGSSQRGHAILLVLAAVLVALFLALHAGLALSAGDIFARPITLGLALLIGLGLLLKIGLAGLVHRGARGLILRLLGVRQDHDHRH